ncbi:MAG: sodium ion-translocating decarboxylase subunit beta, partial [Fusicatenibacter sp.]|nr:sodium ion-translocating decarboxylase subunit beta [Fusicatenibacter sp.]
MITETLNNLLHQTAFFNLDWGNYVMIAVACFFLYLAIKHEFEPLLLVPIAFGMLLVNIYPDIMAEPYTDVQGLEHAGGLFYYFFTLDEWSILPSLIFMGVGAMTDFGPLIANPISFIMGAAAQLGIYLAYFFAIFMGFNGREAAAISIIGGADGPTAIFVTSRLAPELLGSIAVAAYSYMALVPVIQPPIMKALTTSKERSVVMKQLRTVSKTERIIFPIMVAIIVSLIVPDAAVLVGMLMLGNLMKECGVVDRIQ